MTVAGVSAYVSKSGDIRDLLKAIRAGSLAALTVD